ncbi:MAG: hypothetical protein ABIA37_03735 [Candidatus Woesearchaeota archaeon]
MENLAIDEKAVVQGILTDLVSKRKREKSLRVVTAEDYTASNPDYAEMKILFDEVHKKGPQKDWTLTAFDRKPLGQLEHTLPQLICSDLEDAKVLCADLHADTPVHFKIGDGTRYGGTAGMYQEKAAEQTQPILSMEVPTLVAKTPLVEEELEITIEDILESKDLPQTTPPPLPAAIYNQDITQQRAVQEFSASSYQPDLDAILSTKHDNKQSQRFFEAVEFENIFNQNQELGLSVIYFKRNGKFDFRYRRKKKDGVAGGFVSKAYVQEAVEALDKYNSLMEEGSILDLSLAKNLAADYFTEEAATEALYQVKDKVKQKAETILNDKFIYSDCRDTLKIGSDWDGLRKEGIAAIAKYETLMKKDGWENLVQAKELADKYFKNDLSEQLEDRLYDKAVDLAEGLRSRGELLDPEVAKQVVGRLLYNEHSDQLINDDPCDLSLVMDVMKTYPGSYSQADLEEVGRYHQIAMGIPVQHQKPVTAEYPVVQLAAEENLERFVEKANLRPARNPSEEMPAYSLRLSLAY